MLAYGCEGPGFCRLEPQKEQVGTIAEEGETKMDDSALALAKCNGLVPRGRPLLLITCILLHGSFSPELEASMKRERSGMRYFEQTRVGNSLIFASNRLSNHKPRGKRSRVWVTAAEDLFRGDTNGS